MNRRGWRIFVVDAFQTGEDGVGRYPEDKGGTSGGSGGGRGGGEGNEDNEGVAEVGGGRRRIRERRQGLTSGPAA